MKTMDHDIHVHTRLSSCCFDEKASPEQMIHRASEMGIKVLGFANHLWDESIPGASDWYQPQSLSHVLRIREQIPDDTHGVKVLLGCESEYCGNGKVGIAAATAQQLDFVLLPMSHFHMEGFVVEASEIGTLKAIAQLLIIRFQEVIELELATGIAHPFLALGYAQYTDEIIGHISDTAFSDCFGRAAELGVSIEIQPGYFPGCLSRETQGHHDQTFMRVLSIAKSMGCCFHLASDTHSLDGIGKTHLLTKYLNELGITCEHMIQF